MKKIFSQLSLKGQKVIVIGGSGQLGRQTVEILLDANATVINVDINNLKLKNSNYFYYNVDICDEKEVEKFKKKFLIKHKKLNVLINHAHYKGNAKNLEPGTNFFNSVENYSLKEWNSTLDTNLNGLFLITKHFLKILLKNKKSIILNTSSTYGKVSPNPIIYGKSGINSPISYATTKSAIIGFTKYLAAHYGQKGLRANILIPGGIDNKNQSRSFKKNYSKLTPLQRLAKKEEYKLAVLFMVTDASSYMTGSEFVIDGGWTAW